jgi:ribosomal protein S12 methylthiotransferase
MNKGNIDIITMGCSKNLVDSEQLLFLFERNGYNIYHNPTELHGDIVVVNTCGFIGDAKEESIQMILSLCDLKEEGRLNKVYVMGCLSERYLQELGEEIPQVDKFYGKFDWRCLLNDLDSTNVICDSTDRVLTTPSHYAYLKISEGCDRHCAYCAIPIITGKHQSRSEEEILEEVRTLVAKGVTEFQVIAQELTYYGVDLYGKQTIAQLVEKMSEIPGVEWIRLHYAYPAHFPVDLLRVMREKKNVCKYLDIALQHVSDNMLTRMRRNITKAETVALIRKMREEVPGICLRTTLMVGFPGETDDDFRQLCEFVKEMRFERMGAFAYSEEEGTYAAINYEDDVPNEVKQQRLDELMAIQQRISTEISGSYVGRKLRVIIDRKEGEYYIGRTEYDSPEVDCEVLINEQELKIGGYYQVHIDSADEFDLYASFVG